MKQSQYRKRGHFAIKPGRVTNYFRETQMMKLFQELIGAFDRTRLKKVTIRSMNESARLPAFSANPTFLRPIERGIKVALHPAQKLPYRCQELCGFFQGGGVAAVFDYL